MDNWFTIDKTDSNTYIISEYRHWEETHCYLLNGRERSLLIDTGLGISNIFDEVVKLTDKPITAVATHIHWDHIGGHKYFPDFYAHAEELDWLNGKFPLSIETIKEMVVDRCNLPDGFDVNDYEFFQGVPSKVLTDHDIMFAYYPSTDPEAYFNSLKKISSLPVKKVFPAHHSLDIQPEILFRMRKAFEQLEADGKLHHGSGTFNYGDWGVWL